MEKPSGLVVVTHITRTCNMVNSVLLPQTNALIDELAKLIKDAVALFLTYRLSFFDSLIIATATRNNCAYLYSEDMADGQTINGVTIVNPF